MKRTRGDEQGPGLFREEPTRATRRKSRPHVPIKEEDMGYYELKTHGGHALGEVTSALQKSIRRGLEKEAMFWALEMSDSGFGQYLWRG